MNEILQNLIGKICLVYLDDIIIFGNTEQEHLKNIETVFEYLKNANLKIQLDKSEFFKTEVEYLGFVISNEGLKPNTKKIEAIQNIQIPKTVKEIKSLLGKLSWYRRFIPDFSKLTKPFTNCLRKGS
ncbi:MAG: RNA-directed DNA polymerase, partial [Gammaproteobacteria bacterium]